MTPTEFGNPFWVDTPEHSGTQDASSSCVLVALWASLVVLYAFVWVCMSVSA